MTKFRQAACRFLILALAAGLVAACSPKPEPPADNAKGDKWQPYAEFGYSRKL